MTETLEESCDETGRPRKNWTAGNPNVNPRLIDRTYTVELQ